MPRYWSREEVEAIVADYDMLSFGRETPFFVANGELKRSNAAQDQFHLYRLFEFRKAPRWFDMRGAIEQHGLLDPVTERASFG